MKRTGLIVVTMAIGIGVYLLTQNFTAASGMGVTFSQEFDSCRNVKFKVTNERNVAIEVKKIEYYNANKGKWKTEDVSGDDTRCERGASCTIGGNAFSYMGEDLADAEGDRLTKVVFYFKDINSNTTYKSQAFVPSDPVCRVEKVYGHGQGWTISGTSNANDQNSSGGLGDACKNISFQVKNDHSGTIYLNKVKYFNRNSGKWKTEDVKEVACDFGTTCTVGGLDDLADAKDDDITKVTFFYSTFETKSNPYARQRSESKESKVFTPASPKCTEGKIYGAGQGWTIRKKG